MVSHVVLAPYVPTFTALACLLFSFVPLTSCCIMLYHDILVTINEVKLECFIRQY